MTWPESVADDARLRAAKAAYNRMMAAAEDYERWGGVHVTIQIHDVEDGEAALYPSPPAPPASTEPQPLTFDGQTYVRVGEVITQI